MRKTQTNQEHRFKVQDAPVRVDQFLSRKFPDISRAYIQQMISDQLVSINHKVTKKKGMTLQDGDVVTVCAFVHPDDRVIQAPKHPELSIKFEHEHFLIIEKPAGMATHPNEFEDRSCVANHLIGLYPQVQGVGDNALRPGIVHRLDTYTSGLLILAKSQQGYDAFRALFDQREIHKTYIALVLGHVDQDTQWIDTPLAHHEKNPRKMVAIVDESVAHRSTIRQAKSHIEVVERWDQYTLVHVKTLTGRMHQVRVHLASIGHPLVGDTLYQDQRQKHQDRCKLDRHFLHASYLRFQDPFHQELREYTSTLPSKLQACVAQLGG